MANKNVTIEIYDSNGNLVNNSTALTDENGQIIYDYSYLPFGDYNYTIYNQDNPSLMKKGKLYTLVSGNFSGIQAAINAASPGETLYLVDDVYYNDISDNIVIDKPLTIIGVDRTVLDVEGKSRIFTINSGVSDVSLDHIDFINGNTQEGNGGAIYVAEYSNNGVISNVSFTNNTGDVGGGAVKIQNGQGWKVYNSTFINNTAASNGADTGRDIQNGGGAMWSCYGIVDVYNTTFIDNKGSYGGALRGMFNTEDSKFYDNVATYGNGGGIDVTIEQVQLPRRFSHMLTPHLLTTVQKDLVVMSVLRVELFTCIQSIM